MTNISLLRARVRLASLQRLVRVPNLVLLALCQALVYFFLIPEEVRTQANPLDILLIVISTNLVAASGYVINDYYDIKIDSINKPHKVVVGRHITRRKAMLLHLGLSVLGVLLGHLLSWKLALINAACVLLLWLYSHTLKRTLLAGNITIALLAAVAILVVGYYYRSLTDVVLGYALFAFLVSLIREIVKDMEDLKGDATFDCYTLPIALGIARTKWVLYVLLAGYAALLIALVPVAHWPLRIYALLLVVTPSLYLTSLLVRADKKSDFRKLSTICKLIMLAGILSMMLA